MAELVESAARRAEQGWDTREIAPGMTPVLPEEFAYALAHRTQKLVAEILASSEPSRNKPVVGAAPVATEGPSPDLDPGTPRNEPVAAAPAREPAAPEVSRNEPAHPRNMSAKKAREFTAGARLVSRDRETHSYDLITGDGTVIGHVEPSYKAGRRSGWTGWAAGVGRASGQQARSTRDEAGVDALGQWIRIVTAKPRRAVTGG
ncbi:hypothetical protein [Streptomyces sp. NPDC093109]|uniref:hypothetical protein n=1 Tax=Streptomyces sp. NPDC093109 TaxID=3154977 RepID=UPI00344FA1C7